MIHILLSVDLPETSTYSEPISRMIESSVRNWLVVLEGKPIKVETNPVHVHDSGIIQVVRNHRPITDSSSASSDKG